MLQFNLLRALSKESFSQKNYSGYFVVVLAKRIAIMKDTLCETLVILLPSRSEAKHLHYSYVTYCVFNTFLSYTAITMNILTVHAIRKTSSLSKSLKTLLLSLAVSDLGVGLLVQPFYIAFLYMALLHQDLSCAIDTAFLIVFNTFCGASFLSVMAISLDRFLAIHLHLRYKELVTHKRVVTVVISIWVFTVSLYLMLLFWLPWGDLLLIASAIGTFCLILASVLFLKIFVVVWRHNRQIQTQLQQVAQNAGVRNSAVSIFYVYLVFLFCYLPHFCTVTMIVTHGYTIAREHLLVFAFTLMFLNSSLNPLIYCWKMRHIRHAIINILRDILPCRD